MGAQNRLRIFHDGNIQLMVRVNLETPANKQSDHLNLDSLMEQVRLSSIDEVHLLHYIILVNEVTFLIS